jgi:hypothetical protein
MLVTKKILNRLYHVLFNQVVFLFHNSKCKQGYRIVQELSSRWQNINLTVEEGINELAQVCAMDMRVNGKPFCKKIPEPRRSIKKLLKEAKVRLPEVLPSTGKKVATRKN